MNTAKRPSLQEYLKQQQTFYEDHVKFHPANAFCGTAGPEETKHIESLTEALSDEEITELLKKSGIFGSDETLDRDTYESVIDEIDRESFYRIYGQIVARRSKG